MYTPQPTKTDHITLPETLLPLREKLAENVHRVWMETRLSQGWRYGPRRDDEQLTHPGLVPYGELSESEKRFDRATALGTLRLILALGYRIIADEQTEGFPPELYQLQEQIAEDIHDIWSKGRLEQGWRYGPARNDETKEHPCLVPYEELSEEEKEYDRRTAFETLSLILALGYKIYK